MTTPTTRLTACFALLTITTLGAAAARGAGVPPDEYRFTGVPVPATAAVRGIFNDGWAGPRAEVLFPGTPGVAPFLRLEGVAVARSGITYPLRFTLRADDGPETALAIAAPGEFVLLAPLPPPGREASQIRVGLAFARSFVPARTDPGSRDGRELSVLLHSLAVTSAARPVFAAFREGWFTAESNAEETWRWGGPECVVELALERAGTLRIKGVAGTQTPGNEITLSLDGKPFATAPLKETGWSPLAAGVAASAGKHILTLRSRSPGVRPPDDTRTIALGLKNVEFELE